MPIPWALNPVPAMARDAEQVVNSIPLPVRVSSVLAGFSLAISVIIGGLASCFLAYRTAAIKPAEVLRKI
jgi:ABC-type antimicrobial peptide transport system permease subunit